MEPLYLLYLDRYHQGDPLFLKELAQRFSRKPSGKPPALILHTSGEKLERSLEAEGYFPERQRGVIQTETPEQKALAERAAREANQELVGVLTDALVTAVGLQGADRGLLRRTETGKVGAGGLGWVEDLIKMRVLPVVSALAEESGRVEEVPPAEAAVALAEALDAFEVTLCFLAKSPLPEAEKGTVEMLAGNVFSERDVLARAACAYPEVLLTDLQGFFSESGVTGVRIEGG